ncbi:MAG TPA: addiction module protein [Thermoanaerobaculia bacterium]|nr:addiction module protein [Thermoanaerobaculia bacterium]
MEPRRTSLLEEAEKLPLEERLELVEALWDSIASKDIDSLPTLDWHREEIARRLAEYDSDPEAGSSWEEVRARLERLD